MSDELYVEVWWKRDRFGFEWCHAAVVLQGVRQVERSARREKGGEQSNPESARRTAISLAKHEFCRLINDFRDRDSSPPEPTGIAGSQRSNSARTSFPRG